MRVAVLVVLAGCWRTEPPRVTAALTDPPPAPRDPFPLHSEWRGSYRCSQGTTALTLTIDASADGTATAIFEFYPSDENPGVPMGVYRMTGTIRGGPAHTFSVALEPKEWVVAPDGYVMTPLSATSSRKWTRLAGRIGHPACAELDVRRTD